jgi:hypothetical protein
MLMLLTWRLGVKPAKEIDAPGALDLSGEGLAVVVFADVGEVIAAIAEYADDGKWSFPGGIAYACLFCPVLAGG